ncbi:MAG: TfuA-like protein [Terriglobales bacterium]
MKAVVFLGPTLAVAEARGVLEAEYLPPAAQGDVLRAALRGPEAIVLIDGQFDQVPAVWHKELLWAMQAGIHVYGSSSMGALRAAELHAFGMQGAGRIFEEFRDGRLEDDDEVAVTYAAVEGGYRATSEAMVNIRYGLEAAEREGVIAPGERLRLEGVVKQTFYAERSLPLLFEQGGSALAQWWQGRRVDQKREDALALLRQVAERHATAQARVVRDYAVARTRVFEQLMDCVRLEEAFAPVLRELLLDRDVYVIMELWARLRERQLREAAGREPADAGEVQQAEERWRNARDLDSEAALEDWLAQNQLRRDEFTRLMEEEALLQRQTPRPEAMAARLWDVLRLSGTYAEMHRRVRANASREPVETGAEAKAVAAAAWYLAHRGEGRDAVHALFLDLIGPRWDEFLTALAQQSRE